MLGLGAAERRKSYRRKALMAGSIRFKAQTGTLSCVVRDISTTGAKLTLSGTMWLPERFELDIRHRDIRVTAQAVWRRNEAIGIAFLHKADEPFRSAMAEDRVRALEIERDALQRRVCQLSEEF